MNRRTEFYLGIIGGILGMIASVWSAFYYAMWSFLIYPDYMYSNHIVLFIISILGIIGATSVKKHSVRAASYMIIAAVLGFILSPVLYSIPGLLLIIAGGVCLYRGYGHDRHPVERRYK